MPESHHPELVTISRRNQYGVEEWGQWPSEEDLACHKFDRYRTASNVCEVVEADKTTPTAGGGAGMMEALVCHPLGTSTSLHKAPRISRLTPHRHDKSANAALTASTSTRRTPHPSTPTTQTTSSQAAQAKPRSFVRTGAEIVKRETPLGLYKGLGAVMTGIIPKMAIRFTSYESYKGMMSNAEGNISGAGTFVCMDMTLNLSAGAMAN